MRNALLMVGWFALGACTYAQLNARGASVQIVDAPPSGCTNLGIVVGKGGGGMGQFVMNEELIQYAVNDARNKAGERGATHLTYSAPALGASGGQYGSAVTSAMITGIAYHCQPWASTPPGAQPVYQPTPGQPVYQPAPAEPVYQPAPGQQVYQPAPAQQVYQPAPGQQVYQPAPAQQVYQPAPAQQVYQPAPAQPVLQPAAR